MPDLRRRSALTSLYREGRFGRADVAMPGVVLRERRPLQMVQVAAWASTAAAASAAITAVVGAAPAAGTLRASIHGDTAILWMGPDRWLVVAPEVAGRDLKASLTAAVGAAGAVTDQSHSRTVVRLTGANATDLLAKGVGLDLHPRAFPVGTSAGTLLGHLSVVLHAVDATTVDFYVARSFALTAWEWLIDAAAEFGFRVDPAQA